MSIYRYGGIPETQGLLRSEGQTAPDFGQPFELTLSSHQRWHLRAISHNFVAGAGGAARRVRLEILSGATILTTINCRASQAAGTTRTYHWTPIARDLAAFINNTVNAPLPPYLLLAPTFTIRLAADNITVNDRFTLVRTFAEEWIDG